MLFNSIEFFIFFTTVFFLYWFVFYKNLRVQNLLLLISSYVFYGWWDWRFLSLIFLSTIVDYYVGLKIYNSSYIKKKSYLWISILFNLGLLGFFKYFNFFIDSWIDFLGVFGYEHQSKWTLNVIIPVGISFYTFQTMSYSLDIYFKKLKPTKDFISFASFVSFFPQLVAGPIEKATHLLPQFYIDRKFNYQNAVNGLRQILWGFIKKIVIADQCAEWVNIIFNNSTDYQGSTLLLGAFLFSFQIYGDFSGYSDIATGVARLFGFSLKPNFRFPYFSKDISDFWRRWHISLSSWINNYLFSSIALSLRSYGLIGIIFSILITFLLVGLWHGPNWNYLVFGLLHGIALVLDLLLKSTKKKYKKILDSTFAIFLSRLLTFTYVCFTFIFFRAENLEHALSFISEIFSYSMFSKPEIIPKLSILLIIIFSIIEWIGRKEEYGISNIVYFNKKIRWTVYSILSILIFILQVKGQEFIYFQF